MLWMLLLIVYAIINTKLNISTIEQAMGKAGFNTKPIKLAGLFGTEKTITDFSHLDKAIASLKKHKFMHMIPSRNEIGDLNKYTYDDKMLQKIKGFQGNSGIDKETKSYIKYIPGKALYQNFYEDGVAVRHDLKTGEYAVSNGKYIYSAKNGDITKAKVSKAPSFLRSINPFKKMQKFNGIPEEIKDNGTLLKELTSKKIYTKYSKYLMNRNELKQINRAFFFPNVIHDPNTDTLTTLYPMKRLLVRQYKNNIVYMYDLKNQLIHIYDKGTNYVFHNNGYIYKYTKSSKLKYAGAAIGVTAVGASAYYILKNYLTSNTKIDLNKYVENAKDLNELVLSSSIPQTTQYETSKANISLSNTEHEKQIKSNVSVSNPIMSKTVNQQTPNKPFIIGYNTPKKPMSNINIYICVAAGVSLVTALIISIYHYKNPILDDDNNLLSS